MKGHPDEQRDEGNDSEQDCECAGRDIELPEQNGAEDERGQWESSAENLDSPLERPSAPFELAC